MAPGPGDRNENVAVGNCAPNAAQSDASSTPRSPISRAAPGEEEKRPLIRQTLQLIVGIALPNIAAYVLNLLNELTNTVVLGHTGEEAALAAVGLGNMMQNCFGLSIGFGFSAALDLFVSQAYQAGQTERCYHYLQCCRVLTTLNLVWMVPFLAYSENFLLMIGQPADVAVNAGAYNRVTAIGLFFIFQFEANRKFMHNCGWIKAPTVICAVCSLLHIFWCGLFVLYFNLGNAGAGWANVVTWLTEFLLSSYVLASCREMGSPANLLGLSWRGACTGWSEYLSVALPATVQMCSEWWFWEICALIIGYLGATSLAAHVATINFAAVTFMPTIGISASTATLVGTALVCNRPKLAKQIVWVCVVLNLLLWVFLAALIILLNGPIALAYSDSEPVRVKMHWLLCIFAISGFADTTQNVMGGAVRGMGQHQSAAGIYFGVFYLVMLPIGCILAFFLDMGVYGMYVSFLPGCGIVVLIFGVILCRVDWSTLATTLSTEYERSFGDNGLMADSMGESLQPMTAAVGS